jgi:ribonuclease III
MIEKSLTILYDRIHYVFQDESLCLRALSHRSHGLSNNERLEFLGDAVLTLIVTDYLFKRFTYAREGILSRLRARLVRGGHLSRCAAEIGLGDFLRLGPGEMRSGGYRRDSILENAFEALIGAIYLDGGLEAARSMIHQCFQTSFETLDIDQPPLDAKTRLQEYCQKFGHALPEYEIHSVEGAPHDQLFSVICHVKALQLTGEGKSSSRKAAEQEAATQVLMKMESSHES